MLPIPEEELIARLKAGDEQAYTQLYKEFHAPLCRLARLITKDHQQAEDIVSDLLGKLWHLRDDFDTFTRLKAFLYISVKNACLSYLNELKRKNAFYKIISFLTNISIEETLFSEIDPPLVEVIYWEIEKLPPGCRQVFKLHYLEELTIQQIAVKLKRSLSTVYNQKFRAKRLLRRALLRNNMFREYFFR